eukprot:170667-Chlamydomonas_euryale.AAC.1
MCMCVCGGGVKQCVAAPPPTVHGQVHGLHDLVAGHPAAQVCAGCVRGGRGGSSAGLHASSPLFCARVCAVGYVLERNLKPRDSKP